MATTLPFRDYRSLGSDIVEIYVGPDNVHFRVHEKLLCRESAPFDRMFNGGFQEATSKSCHLPEDEPEIFDAFLRWAYSNVLEEPNMEQSTATSGPLWDRIKLFCFAEKYCIEALTDYAMDSILDAYKKGNCHSSAEGVVMAYENTSRGSGIRLYMARCWTRQFRAGPAKRYSEKSVDMLANIPDFSRDVFSILWKNGEQTQSFPYDAPRCDYHRHGKEKPCTKRILTTSAKP